MNVKVLRASRWDHVGVFPTFAKGTPVVMDEKEDDEFLGWHACEILGHTPYVPRAFVADGVLTRDYNPTELIQVIGDMLTVHEIVGAWLLATDSAGVTGWIPAECVISLDA